MSIISKDKLFEKLGGSFWNAGVTFERTNPVPLEKYSIFKTLTDAESYASTNPVAYPGQVVAVIGDTSSTLYYIDNDASLKEIAQGSSVEDALAKLSGTYTATSDKIVSKIVQTDGKISVEFQDLSTGVNAIVDPKFTTLSNNLTSVSSTLDTKINTVSSNLTSVSSTLDTKIDDQIESLSNSVDAIVDTTGLSAATATNPVVTKQDIADLAGAMHFVGAATLSGSETAEDCLKRTFPNAKSGDVAIIVSTSKEYVYVSGTGVTAGWIELGDEKLYATKSEVSTAISTVNKSIETVSSNVNTLSTEVGTISTNLSNALTAEIADRKTNDANISTKVDNKLFIDGVSAEALSTYHISQEEYYKKVIAGSILSNELYIVSSDYTNMYDKQIKNLAEPTDNTDATTKQYVDTAVETATASATQSVSDLSATIDALPVSHFTWDISCISCGNATSN